MTSSTLNASYTDACGGNISLPNKNWQDKARASGWEHWYFWLLEQQDMVRIFPLKQVIAEAFRSLGLQMRFPILALLSKRMKMT